MSMCSENWLTLKTKAGEFCVTSFVRDKGTYFNQRSNKTFAVVAVCLHPKNHFSVFHRTVRVNVYSLTNILCKMNKPK